MNFNHFHYNELTISGITYNRPGLLALCEQKRDTPDVPEWETAFYEFIHEWLNDNEHLVVKTSGSTGKPARVKVSKSAMLWSAFNTIDFFGLTAGQTALLCLSCNFIAGKMMVVRALAGRLNLVPVPVSGTPLRKLARTVDFAAMTPLQMSNELNASPRRTHYLKTVILGGSTTSNELSQKLQYERFQAWETYGMTETLSHIAVRAINGIETNAFFRPMKNVTLDINNRGCLVINAAGITNGPLETNDLVEFNERKEFRIKGRIDNIINTGGIKVSPEDIETRISGLIHQPFFISSRPHPSLGRELVLVVEQQPDNATNLLENIKKKLPPHHAPKKIIVKNPIPRTETGKIKRNAEL